MKSYRYVQGCKISNNKLMMLMILNFFISLSPLNNPQHCTTAKYNLVAVDVLQSPLNQSTTEFLLVGLPTQLPQISDRSFSMQFNVIINQHTFLVLFYTHNIWSHFLLSIVVLYCSHYLIHSNLTMLQLPFWTFPTHQSYLGRHSAWKFYSSSCF